jgi:hypothetical protein
MPFRLIFLSILITIFCGCSDSSDSRPKNEATQINPVIAAAEAAAIETLDLHLEARNNLDADLIASANNYPNVRMLVDNIQVFETHEIYQSVEENITMPNLASSEWDHSEWDEVRVIQSSADKVHLAVEWSRINKDGDRYLSRLQFYFVTNYEGHWGIQIRSPLQDADLLSDQYSRSNPEAESAAREVLNKYMEARNNRDSEALASLNQYPHVLLRGTELKVFSTPEEYASHEENTVIHSLDYSEWDHSELDSVEVVQSSENKVHLAYTCSHFNVVGECSSIEEGLWVITKVDDRWVILGRSMF